MKSDACNTDTLEVRLFSVETLQPLYRHIACHPQFPQSKRVGPSQLAGGARPRPRGARPDGVRTTTPYPPARPRSPQSTYYRIAVVILSPYSHLLLTSCNRSTRAVLPNVHRSALHRVTTGTLQLKPRRPPRPRTLLAPWRLRPPQAPTPPPPRKQRLHELQAAPWP